MLASMIFRKEPFFHGQDNYDQVRTLVPGLSNETSVIFIYIYNGEILGMGPPDWEDVAACLFEPSGLMQHCLM